MKSPYEKKWTLPGGWVDNGPRTAGGKTPETPEQAAIRETEEELGIKAKIVRKLVVNRKSADPAAGRDYPVTDHIFLATTNAKTLELDPREIQDAGHLPRERAIEFGKG